MTRMNPRDCIGAARDELNDAWGRQDDYRFMVLKTLSAVDWLRRALEQMAEAPVTPANTPAQTQHPETDARANP